jgi:two-component system, OmpR family, heavy metal sensor histidine kinase CusS
MRSIRRSLLGYLLLLLALALGAVGVLVDRFANAAVRAREESETGRIEQAYKQREQEARAKLDAELVAEAKNLAKEFQWKASDILGQSQRFGRGGPRVPEPPVRATEAEGREYRLRAEMLLFANTRFVLPTAVTVAAVEPRRGNVFPPHQSYPGSPSWVAFDAPRAVARIQESLRRAFDDDDHPGTFQFSLIATYPSQNSRTLHSVRPARLTTDLPIDPAWLEPPPDAEPGFDDVEVAGKSYRRVVTNKTAGGRSLFFGVWLAHPPTPTSANPVPNYRPSPRPDVVLRVLVHHARPYSELDARLAADQLHRDEQLASVRDETGAEMARLRGRLALIGGCTFFALVLGGWLIVAWGMAPLHKLSDAVSRVSEKDFRLPVVPGELGRELVPIHARITQTLTLLQRAFAREKQAVADISHELRTPIASLLATIDVALRKPRTSEQYRTALEECRLISKQLGQLVERIMTLASLDAGNDHMQLARTDAAELVAGCAAVIRPLVTSHNLTLSVHTDDELVMETDAAKLREVLMNLLHNAIEYNSPGGNIELSARREGASAVFEVRDSGIGMAPEVREKIFERFYRADSSRHATGVHAGLGLAIVKEYVARLSGAIEVESEPGAGTTFRVTLPATLAESDAGQPQRVPARRDASVPAAS